MNLKSFLSSLALTFLLFSVCLAQTTPPADTSTEEKKKAQQELENKALILLSEILDSAPLLRLPENRSYVFAIGADLLWKHDEKRARLFFQAAMNDLALAIKNPNSSDFSRGDSLWLIASQRQQILTTAARHDPQFALELLQSTRQVFAENQPFWARIMDQDLMLEQSIAAEVASNDPKRALKMAQESLTKGVSYQTLALLNKLQSKDSEAATTFAGDIVKRLRTTDFAKSREASLVAQGLLRLLLRPDRGNSNAQSSSTKKKTKTLELDEQTTRDLIDIVLNSALNASSDRYEMISLQGLFPELEKRVPERVAQLRKKLAENSEKMDPAMKLMMQYQSLLTDGKPDELLEAAAKAPSDMRGYLYKTAASRMMRNGDLEGARKVVVEFINGPDRDEMLTMLDQKLISRALEQEKMDEARKLIARITPNEARLAQIASLATSIFKKGDRKMAIALIDETEDLVNRSPENQQELVAMLKVAKAYSVIEPRRAFVILENVIDQTNSLLAAAAVLAKFGADIRFFRDAEFEMQSSMAYTRTLASQFGKELALLAQSDFARTRGLADRFQRDETRTMARLLVAQAVLTDHSEKESSGDIAIEGFGNEE